MKQCLAVIATSITTAVVVSTAQAVVVTADSVVPNSYNAGSPTLTSYWGAAYTNTSAALGLPTPHQDIAAVSDGQGGFLVYPDDSVISPVNGAYNPDHVLGIGSGGSVDLHLSQAIPGNGGLIVHTGSGYQASFSTGLTIGATYTDPRVANVSVSADGTSWVSLGLTTFEEPTNYYADSTDGFGTADGSVVADFEKPFTLSPSAFDGKTYAQTVALFDGSAGGTFIDISGSGLASVQFVEFTVPVGELLYVDSVVGVPEPGTLAVLGIAGLLLVRRRSIA